MTTTTKPGFGARIAAKIADLLDAYPAPAVEAPAVAPTVGSTVEVPADVAVAVLAARAAVAAAEAAKESAEAALKTLVGDAHEVTVNGDVVFSYKPQNRSGLDVKALREAEPLVAAQFATVTVVRPLLVRPKMAAKLLA